MSSRRGLWLVIDQGGQSTRAAIVNEQGRVVTVARAAVRESRRGARMQLDAETLWGSLRRVLRRVQRQLGRSSSRVRAAALVTQRSTVVCWDRRTGRALTPIISWQDRRNAAWLDGFKAHAAAIERRTGLRLSPHYGASKLRWCLEHSRAVRRARLAGRLACGPLASFLLCRLTAGASLLIDPANASRTLLYDPLRRDWSEDLLSLFGIERSLLPACVPTRHPYGEMAWGRGTLPIALVSGDQSCALFGYGTPDRHTAYVNIGTGAFVQRLVAEIPEERSGLLASVVYSDRARVTSVLEGTVNGAAAAIEAVAATLRVSAPFKRLGRWLDEPYAPPLFINAVSGIGAPYWRSDLESRFIGRGDPPRKLVAVAESVVFLINVNIEVMDRIGGAAHDIVVSGGLAGIDALCQRLANLSGRRVRRPTEREATVRGAAFLMAGRPQSWRQLDAQVFPPRSDRALRERYARWRAMLDQQLGALEADR